MRQTCWMKPMPMASKAIGMTRMLVVKSPSFSAFVFELPSLGHRLSVVPQYGLGKRTSNSGPELSVRPVRESKPPQDPAPGRGHSRIPNLALVFHACNTRDGAGDFEAAD